MSDALLALLRINLAIAAAVVVVLALRLPVRRLFGAGVAYGLWALAPLAALAMLAPARVVTVAIPSAPQPELAPMALELAAPALHLQPSPDLWPLAGLVWIAGGLLSLAYLGWRQIQFFRAVRRGRAGPAVVGVLHPRIVTPVDFGERYTPREQLVVLAHEATHIARQDCRINAAVALARCLNWFNPAIHLMAHYLRLDQEFACDAQVIAAHPTARRPYAEAMLKAQLAARPLPLGCYWPAQSAHPLTARIRLLARKTPGRGRRRAGAAAVALLGLAAAWSAWAARPAQIVEVPVASPVPRETTSTAVSTARPIKPAEARRKTTPDEPRPAPIPAHAPVISGDVLTAAVQASADAQIAATQPETSEAPAPFRARNIRTVARQSAVAPGSAVRVLATMIDPDGRRLTTDLTAFGSQSVYRTGWFQRNGSRYALFTSVYQDGDRFWVSASLDRRFQAPTSGTIILGSGETGNIVLGNGQIVTVTPAVRPETAEEVEEGKRALRNMSAIQPRVSRGLWRSNGYPCKPGYEGCRSTPTPWVAPSLSWG
jgi:beta-lactamase regulating signal transducer with metallopeptidase domain